MMMNASMPHIHGQTIFNIDPTDHKIYISVSISPTGCAISKIDNKMIMGLYKLTNVDHIKNYMVMASQGYVEAQKARVKEALVKSASKSVQFNSIVQPAWEKNLNLCLPLFSTADLLSPIQCQGELRSLLMKYYT